jgi:hypothetical protein
MVSLSEAVQRYIALAGEFGEPVALGEFGLSEEQTRNLFSTFDEDYHISRFLHFSRAVGQEFEITGQTVTHVAMDAGVQSLI